LTRPLFDIFKVYHTTAPHFIYTSHGFNQKQIARADINCEYF